MGSSFRTILRVFRKLGIFQFFRVKYGQRTLHFKWKVRFYASKITIIWASTKYLTHNKLITPMFLKKLIFCCISIGFFHRSMQWYGRFPEVVPNHQVWLPRLHHVNLAHLPWFPLPRPFVVQMACWDVVSTKAKRERHTLSRWFDITWSFLMSDVSQSPLFQQTGHYIFSKQPYNDRGNWFHWEIFGKLFLNELYFGNQ